MMITVTMFRFIVLVLKVEVTITFARVLSCIAEFQYGFTQILSMRIHVHWASFCVKMLESSSRSMFLFTGKLVIPLVV